MLELIRRLSSFGMAVIVSSHVLSDIEQTCDRVVMLDAGSLLRSGPLTGSETTGTVSVELLDQVEAVAEALRARGIAVKLDGPYLAVGPGDESLERAVLETAAQVGTGVLRMGRGSASLEDLFLANGERK